MPVLYDLETRRRAAVALSSPVSPAILAFLGETGLVSGVEVEVIDKQPSRGPVVLEVAGAERALGARAGRNVRALALASGLDK